MFPHRLKPKRILQKINLWFSSPSLASLMCIVNNRHTHHVIGSLSLQNEISHSCYIERENIEDVCIKIFRVEDYEELAEYQFEEKYVRGEETVERREWGWKVRKQELGGLVFMFQFVFTGLADYGDFPRAKRTQSREQGVEDNSSRNHHEIQKIIRANFIGKKYYRVIVEEAVDRYLQEKRQLEEKERQRQMDREREKQRQLEISRERERERVKQAELASHRSTHSKAPWHSHKAVVQKNKTTVYLLNSIKTNTMISPKNPKPPNPQPSIHLLADQNQRDKSGLEQPKKRMTIEEKIQLGLLGCHARPGRKDKQLKWKGDLEVKRYRGLMENLWVKVEKQNECQQKQQMEKQRAKVNPIRSKLERVLQKKCQQRHTVLANYRKKMNQSLNSNRSKAHSPTMTPHNSQLQQSPRLKLRPANRPLGPQYRSIY